MRVAIACCARAAHAPTVRIETSPCEYSQGRRATLHRSECRRWRRCGSEDRQTHPHELVDACAHAALLPWIGGESEHKDVDGAGDDLLETSHGEAVPQQVGKDKMWREKKVAGVDSTYASASTVRDDEKDAIACEADVGVPTFIPFVRQGISDLL